LGLAADAVRAHGSTGTVVLADSGLQTKGALDYTTPGMLLADPSQLAELLAEDGQLPDLTGVTVALSGIGYTAQPQQPLDNANRERLRQQWVQLVTAAGAACVFLDEMPNTQPAPDGVPPVTPVVPPPPPEYDFDEPIPLPEDVLPFRDNSPELVDPQAARETLEPLAVALQGTTGTIRLTGTTASGGTEAGRLELSRERAETVKRLLGSLGVDASRITTEGVGTHFPGYQEDLDENGNQIEEIAKQNRLVILEVVGG
jgi:OOP family OmpA-OmpF porin